MLGLGEGKEDGGWRVYMFNEYTVSQADGSQLEAQSHTAEIRNHAATSSTNRNGGRIPDASSIPPLGKLTPYAIARIVQDDEK